MGSLKFVPNRLAAESSPYLLQHRDNPVDWFAWGDEALAKAREEDKPLLVSVGYSACHWCHVMAHESFEDAETAALMNEHFVAIKVDREERPDIDAICMEACQAMTGHGGWPLNAFLTPAQEPFYAGTYFPPEPRHGLPSWRMVLEAIAEAWRERRARRDRGREPSWSVRSAPPPASNQRRADARGGSRGRARSLRGRPSIRRTAAGAAHRSSRRRR